MEKASYEELEQALQEELRYLWNELNEQMLKAINCTWSIGALNAYDRIVWLTLLVGPINWRDVPMNRLVDGTYAEVHKAMGVEVEEVPPEEMEKMRVRELRRGEGLTCHW